MWQCVFEEQLKSLKNFQTPTFEKILLREQSEHDLLSAIENGEVFGFLECDLISSPEAKEKFKNFPPIIKRYTITNENLTETTCNAMCNENKDSEKFSRETLIQCYNAKGKVQFFSSLFWGKI